MAVRDSCCDKIRRWKDNICSWMENIIRGWKENWQKYSKIGCMWFCIVVVAVTGAIVFGCYGFIMHTTVTIDEASLTRFSLITSPVTALAYNLSLTMAINNNNWAMNIKYKGGLEAEYSFDGQRFDRVPVIEPGYVQTPWKSNVYHLNSRSEGAYVALGNAGIENFEKQNATGVFHIQVDMKGKIQYQAHLTWCTLDVSCPLKLRLAPAGTNEVVFVQCKVAKADKDC